jgi:hypothetical protein
VLWWKCGVLVRGKGAGGDIDNRHEGEIKWRATYHHDGVVVLPMAVSG